MTKKLINEDPFSNGSEHMMFECRCCDNCIKNSWWDEKHNKFVNADDKNQPKCSIQRDIVTRMVCDEPIKQETVDIGRNFVLHETPCPYMKTERKKYAKKVENQTTLEL